ncbi:hypothetical protein [Comamonas sp. GB3 AK4-5]|uniref:hypothetical protein n=1 Tax=Comamonas sp. GB3 AK4-5 TaxID=3231487 RepID=UPI00351E9BD1
MSPAQWVDVGNIEALQQMLMDLDLQTYADLEQLRSTAMAALRRAHAAGLDDRNDLATFAAKAVTVHPNFDRHPQIAALLAHKQAGDYFTALIDDLSVTDWQRIARDMDVPQAIEPARN